MAYKSRSKNSAVALTWKQLESLSVLLLVSGILMYLCHILLLEREASCSLNIVKFCQSSCGQIFGVVQKDSDLCFSISTDIGTIRRFLFNSIVLCAGAGRSSSDGSACELRGMYLLAKNLGINGC